LIEIIELVFVKWRHISNHRIIWLFRIFWCS